MNIGRRRSLGPRRGRGHGACGRLLIEQRRGVHRIAIKHRLTEEEEEESGVAAA